MSTAVDTSRPSRAEIEPAALELIRSHGAQIMATARRYACSPEDAEDAYQRGLEILLTKAPTTSAGDLVPWLKTVVKHEAFALRKQRERNGVPTEYDDSRPAVAETHEQVERLDQLQRGAEAMQRLKPAEVRCLLLLAEGHSYAEICAITGFTYTKVNRCLAEGRQSFVERVAGIEAGAECERFAPLISAAADGEAGPDDMLALRRHMRGCLACRASLREARQVPARVAALTPAGLVLAPHGGGGGGLWHWLHERLASFALRGQEVVEAAAAHKAVAVAASAAALAGTGVATVHVAQHREPVHAKRAAAVVAPAPAPAPTVAVEQRTPKVLAAPAAAAAHDEPTRRHHAPKPQAPVAPPAPAAPEPPPTDPASGAAGPEPAATAPPSAPKPAPKPSGSPDGEFAP